VEEHPQPSRANGDDFLIHIKNLVHAVLGMRVRPCSGRTSRTGAAAPVLPKPAALMLSGLVFCLR